MLSFIRSFIPTVYCPSLPKRRTMLSNPADVLGHLRSNISFKTYSDSKLASLYLDNPDNFPFHLMVKVFDVILDPHFKLEDITFKSLWDVFEHKVEVHFIFLSVGLCQSSVRTKNEMRR